MKLGVMQGRLLDYNKSQPQIFPFNIWENEIDLANKLKLNSIQWLYLNSVSKKNPILDTKTQKLIIKINKKNNVKINSICAHEFLVKPIINKSKIDKVEFNKLVNLIKVSKKINIKYIVLPLIEKSSIKDFNKDIFIIFLRKIDEHLKKNNIQLHIESDLSSKKLSLELKKVNSMYIKICIDLGNSFLNGFNLTKEINDSKNYIGSYHIKEKDINGNSLPLGSLNFNYKLFFKKIYKNRFMGEIILETQNFKNKKSFDSIEKNINYLKQFI